MIDLVDRVGGVEWEGFSGRGGNGFRTGEW